MQPLVPEAIYGNYLIRLTVAALLGALIGLERDIHGREAGLRTNILISLGAAVFMLVSEWVAYGYGTILEGTELQRADPGRIAAQVVTGIGFLGAGSIIKAGFTIRGLTTAACIWVSAGIGMSAGAGFFELAGAAAVISLFSLIILNKLEKLYHSYAYKRLEIIAEESLDISQVLAIFTRSDIKVIAYDYKKNYRDNEISIRLALRIRHKDNADDLSRKLVKDLEGTNIPLVEVYWSQH